MTEKVILQNAVETSVSANKTGAFGSTLLLCNVGARAYVYFALPVFPQDVTIVSATLRVRPSRGENPVTLSVKRLLSPFDPNRVVWNTNEPQRGPVLDSETDSTDDFFVFNVTTAIVNAVAGAPWYGFGLESNSPLSSWALYSSRSQFPLSLTIEYVTKPPTPDSLEPRGDVEISESKPHLSWMFQGYTAGSFPVAHSVQFASDINFNNLVYDFGVTSSGASTHDTSQDNGFGGLATGATIYWRVKVRNDSGAWSEWSPAARFKYTGPNSINITSPGTETPDPTPDVTWTYGDYQASYQVIVENENNYDGRAIWTLLYDTGVVASEAKTHTLPPGVIDSPNKYYRVTVRLWSNTNNQAVPGSRNDIVDVQEFSWVPSGATPPVDLQVLNEAPIPNKRIRWRYNGPTPNGFMVYRRSSVRRDPVVRSVDAISTREGNSEWYSIDDLLVPGRADITWEVQTLTPGGSSQFNPSVTQHVHNAVPWVISAIDTKRAFNMVDADIDPGLSEVSDVVVPVAGKPFIVQQALQGFVGSASGEISWDFSTSDLTAQDMIDNFLWIRENPQVYFVWQDQAIEAFIYNCAYTPYGRADGKTDYGISFNFVEV